MKQRNIRSREHGQRAWNDNRIWIITLEYSDYGIQEHSNYGFEDFDTKLVYTQTVVVGTERWFREAVSEAFDDRRHESFSD